MLKATHVYFLIKMHQNNLHHNNHHHHCLILSSADTEQSWRWIWPRHESDRRADLIIQRSMISAIPHLYIPACVRKYTAIYSATYTDVQILLLCRKARKSEVGQKSIHLDLQPGCLDSRERVRVCWLQLVSVEPVPDGVAVTDLSSTPLSAIALSPNHTSEHRTLHQCGFFSNLFLT